MRTDSERLDWLAVPGNLEKVSACALGHDSFRECLDAAMDAEEARELEAAWKWFRTSELGLRRWYTSHGHYVWQACGNAAENILADGENRDWVILAAYRASKGSKT